MLTQKTDTTPPSRESIPKLTTPLQTTLKKKKYYSAPDIQKDKKRNHITFNVFLSVSIFLESKASILHLPNRKKNKPWPLGHTELRAPGRGTVQAA